MTVRQHQQAHRAEPAHVPPGGVAPQLHDPSEGLGNGWMNTRLPEAMRNPPAPGRVPPFREVALATARADQAALLRTVAAMERSTATRTRNTAEWLRSGRLRVRVLSLVDQSVQNPGGSNRWFGADVDPFAGVVPSYEGPTGPGVVERERGTSGAFDDRSGTLWVFEPSRMGDIATTLEHEVFHDADQFEENAPWGVAGTQQTSGRVFGLYQTEFRAFSFENPEPTNPLYGAVSTAPAHPGRYGVVGPDRAERWADGAFRNARQQAIFEALTGSVGRAPDVGQPGTFTDLYSSFRWYYVMDPAFRAMVHAFDRPAAGNGINSVRIQALSDAIEGGNVPTSALGALDAADRAWLHDREQSAPFWTRARTRLRGAPLELERLERAL